MHVLLGKAAAASGSHGLITAGDGPVVSLGGQRGGVPPRAAIISSCAGENGGGVLNRACAALVVCASAFCDRASRCARILAAFMAPPNFRAACSFFALSSFNIAVDDQMLGFWVIADNDRPASFHLSFGATHLGALFTVVRMRHTSTEPSRPPLVSQPFSGSQHIDSTALFGTSVSRRSPAHLSRASPESWSHRDGAVTAADSDPA